MFLKDLSLACFGFTTQTTASLYITSSSNIPHGDLHLMTIIFKITAEVWLYLNCSLQLDQSSLGELFYR